nr:synembryn-like protein c3e7.04c [Quercus suber]
MVTSVLAREVACLNEEHAASDGKACARGQSYGFDRGATYISREALRCLANALLLNEPSRQMFVDLGYALKAAERLQVDDRDDEFLISRLLFLLTYNTDLDFETLFAQNRLAASINQHVSRHSERVSSPGRSETTTPPIINMALAETMKLIFNITYYHPKLSSEFTPAIEPIIDILLHEPLPTPPLQPSISYLLNALLNLDLPSLGEVPFAEGNGRPSSVLPPSKSNILLDRLISILDNAVRQTPEAELDQAAATLITLLRRLYELAPAETRTHMRAKLLPSVEDRDKPLGQGDKLAARLLRLSCSPGLPTLRENISSLLFELSDRDANKFVRNIGYGYASGFLMSHDIPVPTSATETNAAAVDDGSEHDVNPITGQRIDAGLDGSAEAAGLPEMTEAEREWEAERLFVLFERLRATGVVDVQNPVRQAMEEGRFEEVD